MGTVTDREVGIYMCDSFIFCWFGFSLSLVQKVLDWRRVWVFLTIKNCSVFLLLPKNRAKCLFVCWFVCQLFGLVQQIVNWFWWTFVECCAHLEQDKLIRRDEGSCQFSHFHDMLFHMATFGANKQNRAKEGSSSSRNVKNTTNKCCNLC